MDFVLSGLELLNSFEIIKLKILEHVAADDQVKPCTMTVFRPI